LRAYGMGALMEPSGGTQGSVDDVIIGSGLDPQRASAVASPRELDGSITAPTPPPPAPPEAPEVPEVVAASEPSRASADRVAWQTVGGAAGAVLLAVGIAAVLAAWGLGPATAPNEAPNLIGISLERAASAAEDAGFELAPPIYTHRADRPEDTVVDQVPPPGTSLDAGSSIQPIVSTGRQLVNVPDVIGQTEAQAIATLTAAGLTVRRTGTVDDDAVQAGSIVSTAPAAGSSVGSGTVVSYEVSSGPAATPTPSAAPTIAATASPGPAPTSTPTVAPSTATPTLDTTSPSPSGPSASASEDATPGAPPVPPSPSVGP
jgi:beta-lactam-binding protein with PASTA domain